MNDSPKNSQIKKSLGPAKESIAILDELKHKVSGREVSALLDWLEKSVRKLSDYSERALIVASCAIELAEARSVVEVLDATLKDAIRLTGAERGYILIWNENSKRLERASDFDAKNVPEPEELEICNTVAERVFASGEVIINPDVSHDPALRGLESVAKFKIRSVLAAPLTAESEKGRKVLGVVYLDSRVEKHLFNDDDAALMKSFAALAGLSIANTLSAKQLRRTYFETVSALIRALEAKDPYTAGHSERVAEYSVRCGAKMGMSEAKLTALRSAALLHDIGKIGIRDSVLFKPGKLTDEEFEHIKHHADLSEDIVRGLSYLEEELAILSGSQEHYDGTGYPRGTKGDEISREAYIIQVADAWDAMTSTRVYRKAMPIESAIAELKRCSGSQFHPEVVEAFLDMIGEQGLIPSDDVPQLPR